ncbi:MAG: substrate-binding domain-containing protein [Bacteroidaceae bacterium]|nr:substrate-binding domain-containing protein [Bacteroidaceae bacterium]
MKKKYNVIAGNIASLSRQGGLIMALVAVLLLLSSCHRGRTRYYIGVSQCSEDIWRDWQNAEMKMEASLHEGVRLSFATAHDDSGLQIAQIDSLVDSGIDLLIVAPNQLQSVSSAIDGAYDRGIPVIVFERKTDSRKYTAFVSADNYAMGQQMGEYIASRLGGKGKVMEIMGLKGSSPADERHRGFRNAIERYPQIQVVASLQGDWTEERAYKEVEAYLKGHPSVSVDVVFGHNDRTAMGARRAFDEAGGKERSAMPLPLFCGIDGLPGIDGGILQVRDSLLTASYIYPTRGDLLLQLALDILEGRPYEKETMLTSALVTKENANVLYLEGEEVVRRSQRLERLQEMASGYLEQLSAQRTLMALACGLVVLLFIALLLFYLYHRGQMNIRRERVLNNLWNLNVRPEDTEKAENTVEVVTEAEEASCAPSYKAEHSLFISRFREIVERRMTDSELSVEDLAAAMNLSRVQLYRKVKMITGNSPVELLRSARLNRGYQLLITTDKTVSEVAYAVGFSAPAYFTKCFKDEFGIVPGEVRGKG